MSKTRILAVDDDPVNLDIILESLRDLDFEIRLAHGGR